MLKPLKTAAAFLIAAKISPRQATFIKQKIASTS